MGGSLASFRTASLYDFQVTRDAYHRSIGAPDPDDTDINDTDDLDALYSAMAEHSEAIH